MNKETIIQGNQLFFIVTVGMAFGMEVFADQVRESSLKMAQFETDLIGESGYIRIDSSSVRREGQDWWNSLVDKIREGFLGGSSYEFSSQSNFGGDLSEKVVFTDSGYKFELEIKKYERDELHGYEFITPETVLSDDIPDEEVLGRVVYLTISLETSMTKSLTAISDKEIKQIGQCAEKKYWQRLWL